MVLIAPERMSSRVVDMPTGVSTDESAVVLLGHLAVSWSVAQVGRTHWSDHKATPCCVPDEPRIRGARREHSDLSGRAVQLRRPTRRPRHVGEESTPVSSPREESRPAGRFRYVDPLACLFPSSWSRPKMSRGLRWTVMPAREARSPEFRKQLGPTFVNTPWRRRWDLNPRKVSLHTISNRADSAALALLQDFATLVSN